MNNDNDNMPMDGNNDYGNEDYNGHMGDDMGD